MRRQRRRQQTEMQQQQHASRGSNRGSSRGSSTTAGAVIGSDSPEGLEVHPHVVREGGEVADPREVVEHVRVLQAPTQGRVGQSAARTS